ncbi:HAD-IA family hydrolase [Aureibacillus halotolerans]|uniref:Phosphoglycolate phosphatase n=1 Tax=Aureibacillus halotolerans TaxID=1508390 RepID=A0A4R6U6S3_9BACI|nr:HAD-IA family hydrolase [Aureibacillus halotolerans]TDQ40409.1 phosphoglycolate phosphatase [Aureibacillus halotolerans]
MYYRYVLFDFDGTLVDSVPLAVRIFNELASTHGFKHIHAKDMRPLKEASIKQKCELLGVPIYKIPQLLHVFRSRYREQLDSLDFIDGIEGVIRTAAEKSYQMGVLSSNDERVIQSFLHKNNAEMFHEIIGRSSLYGKASFLRKFLRQKQLSPKEVLYIGDEERDIFACKETGIDIAAVTWGFEGYEQLYQHKPRYLFTSPSELGRLLNTIDYST